MIVVNGHEFKTLDDVFYANGQRVVKAYANGMKVYPEEKSKYPDDGTGIVWVDKEFFAHKVYHVPEDTVEILCLANRPNFDSRSYYPHAIYYSASLALYMFDHPGSSIYSNTRFTLVNWITKLGTTDPVYVVQNLFGGYSPEIFSLSSSRKFVNDGVNAYWDTTLNGGRFVESLDPSQIDYIIPWVNVLGLKPDWPGYTDGTSASHVIGEGISYGSPGENIV